MKIAIKRITITKLQNILLIALFSIIISGCAGPMISKLQKTPRTGDKFSIALTEEYQTFAEYEMNEMKDEVDALYFARKGYKSAQGEHVLPELLDNWKIPENKLIFLKKARKELIALLPESKIKNPVLSAKAQSSFDCWVEQQEENWQLNHIDKCRKAFKNSINKIYSVLNPVETKQDPPPNPTNTVNANNDNETNEENSNSSSSVETQNNSKKIEETYRIYFTFDSYKLSKENLEKINNIFNVYVSGSYINITVEGHTDSAGTNKYNSTLSLKRAESVKNAFLQLGVNNNEISILSFGETKPLIETQDGVREPKNRRAKVVISE